MSQASKALGTPKSESLSLDTKRSLVFHGVELDEVPFNLLIRIKNKDLWEGGYALQ